MMAMSIVLILILGIVMWGWIIECVIVFKFFDQFYDWGYWEVDGAINYFINKNFEGFCLVE